MRPHVNTRWIPAIRFSAQYKYIFLVALQLAFCTHVSVWVPNSNNFQQLGRDITNLSDEIILHVQVFNVRSFQMFYSYIRSQKWMRNNVIYFLCFNVITFNKSVVSPAVRVKSRDFLLETPSKYMVDQSWNMLHKRWNAQDVRSSRN